MFGSASKQPATPSFVGSNPGQSSFGGSNVGGFGSGISAGPFGQTSGSFGSGASGGARSTGDALFGQKTGSSGSAVGGAGGGGLFGQKTGFGASSGGGLFGQTSGNSSGILFGLTSSGASGGLFGQTSSPVSAGLFGQTSGVTGGNLFGPSSGGAGGGGTSLFGAAGGFESSGGGIFVQGAGQGPGFSGLRGLGYSEPTVEIKGKTRVSQLPESMQKELLMVETHLREQRTKSAKLWAKRTSTEDALKQLSDRFAAFDRGMVRSSAQLESLKANAALLRAALQNETRSAADVRVTTENLISAMQGGLGTLYGASFVVGRVPIEYFGRIVGDLEARAYDYKKEIDEIAEYLRAISSGSYRGVGESQLDGGEGKGNMKSKGRIVQDILKRQFEYFMVVANQVASVHESLRALKGAYLQLLWQRGSEGFDPFLQADRREKSEKERQKLMAEHSRMELYVPQQSTAVVEPSTHLPSSSAKRLNVSLDQKEPGSSSRGSSLSAGLFGGSSGPTSSETTGLGTPALEVPLNKQGPTALSFRGSARQTGAASSSFLSEKAAQPADRISSNPSLTTPGQNSSTGTVNPFNSTSSQNGATSPFEASPTTGAPSKSSDGSGDQSSGALTLSLKPGQSSQVTLGTAVGKRGASDSTKAPGRGGYKSTLPSFKDRNLRRKKK